MSKRSLLIKNLYLLCFLSQITYEISVSEFKNILAPPPPSPFQNSQVSQIHSHNQLINNGLRKFPWNPITSDVSNTFFYKLPAQELNENDVKDFFAVPPPKITAPPKEKSNQPPLLKFLDDKENIQVSVAIKVLPEVSIVKDALQSMDSALLSPENVKRLKSIFITQDHLDIYNQEKNPNANWDSPEKYLVDLNTIPNALSKLKVWDYINGFEEDFAIVKDSALKIKQGIENFRSSEFISTFISQIITIGNYLNQGHRKFGNAKGFEIEFLSKLNDIKGKNKVTAVQYILKKIRDEKKIMFPFSEIIKTKDVFPNIFSAAEISKEDVNKILNQLSNEFNVLTKDFGIIENEEDSFVLKAKPTWEKIRIDINIAKSQLLDLDRQFNQLQQYFPSGESNPTINNYFQNVINLFLDIDKAIPKIIEEEKKNNALLIQKNERLGQLKNNPNTNFQNKIKKGFKLNKNPPPTLREVFPKH